MESWSVSPGYVIETFYVTDFFTEKTRFVLEGNSMKSYLLGSLNVKSFISVDDKQAESSQLAQLHCNTSSMAGWLLMTSSLANLAGFYLHGETV